MASTTAGRPASTSLALSNREEDDLVKTTKREALQKCDDVVREFANCSTGRTVSVAWACRAQHRAVQACMKPYTSDEAMGERRRAYLREKRARNRAAAAVAAAADADVAAAAQDPIVRRDVVYEPLPMVAASNGQAEARAGAGTATLRPQQQQQQSPPPVASLFSSGKAQAQQPQQRLV